MLSLVSFTHQPEESLGDDFLFPMSSAASARLSAVYGSSPESDAEFCDAETPRASRTHLDTLGGGGGTINGSHPGPLPRSTSDPSLAPKDDRIPDYNAPPPYAVPPAKVRPKKMVVILAFTTNKQMFGLSFKL